MKPEDLVDRTRIEEKAQAWQNQLADRTDHDRRVYVAGFFGALEELGVERVLNVEPMKPHKCPFAHWLGKIYCGDPRHIQVLCGPANCLKGAVLVRADKGRRT